MDWAREARWARGPGPLGPGARARAPPRPSPSAHKQISEVFQVFVSKNIQKQKHENQTFWASLKPQGPRDRICGKERKILFRIGLTRALYDQMATQLYHFYVPGQPSKRTLCTRHVLVSKRNTSSIKGKSQLVLFIYGFTLDPT